MYSYDRVENLVGLRIHSAESIHPEWQQLSAATTCSWHALAGSVSATATTRRMLLGIQRRAESTHEAYGGREVG
jgi:hypothetical protein